MYITLLTMQREREYSEKSSPEDDDKSGIRKQANREYTPVEFVLMSRSMCR